MNATTNHKDLMYSTIPETFPHLKSPFMPLSACRLSLHQTAPAENLNTSFVLPSLILRTVHLNGVGQNIKSNK